MPHDKRVAFYLYISIWRFHALKDVIDILEIRFRYSFDQCIAAYSFPFLGFYDYLYNSLARLSSAVAPSGNLYPALSVKIFINRIINISRASVADKFACIFQYASG